MAKSTGSTFKGVTCECGQIFSTQAEYNQHIGTGECPAHGAPNREEGERKMDMVIAEARDVADEKEAKRQAALAERLLAKEMQEAKDKILSEANKIRDAAIAQENLVIPYSMCDHKIAFLPKTRPIFLTVECVKTDIGLLVKKVKPGYK